MKTINRSGNLRQGRVGLKVQHGSSLIEVLVSLAVLSVGLVSLTSFQGRLVHDSHVAKLRTDAVQVAEARLEQFRHYTSLADYDNYASGSDTVGPTGSGADVQIDNLTETFTRTWQVTDAGNVKTFVLTVTWPGKSGDASYSRFIKLNTAIARVDPLRSAVGVPSA
jgi:prepilin-type N-terminal cleavage/methylation domain-containing protein